MTVGGIYDLRLPPVEKSMVYVSLAEAQTLFDLRGQATEVVVALHDVEQEPAVVAALRAALPGYEVNSWQDVNPEMKQAFEMNEQFASIFGLVVVLIAGIGILNLLLMAVFERTREIGLLAALGLKQRNILVLFLLEGVLIGLAGALAGCVLGGLAVGILERVGIGYAGLSEVSEISALMGDRLYPHVGITLVVGRAVTVAIIAAIASLYPAWRASRQEPAEALHYV
jgi:ABC-type lipoprotein release transport system permease subunit